MICCFLRRTRWQKASHFPLDPAMLAGAVTFPKASHVNAGLDASIAFKAMVENLYNVLCKN